MELVKKNKFNQPSGDKAATFLFSNLLLIQLYPTSTEEKLLRKKNISSAIINKTPSGGWGSEDNTAKIAISPRRFAAAFALSEIQFLSLSFQLLHFTTLPSYSLVRSLYTSSFYPRPSLPPSRSLVADGPFFSIFLSFPRLLSRSLAVWLLLLKTSCLYCCRSSRWNASSFHFRSSTPIPKPLQYQ